jgi:metal-responsive CopG/Arc/MetJ family transcriptional regulator
MKTTIVLDDELVEKIDQAVKLYGINRSMFIRFATKHELERLGLLEALSSRELLTPIKTEAR